MNISQAAERFHRDAYDIAVCAGIDLDLIEESDDWEEIELDPRIVDRLGN